MSKLYSLMLIVLSTCMYQITAEKVNNRINPFASLIITYITALFISTLLYFLTNRNGRLLSDIKNVNLFSILLGIAICLLETGWILAYRNGWEISKLSPIVSSSAMIILALIGVCIYHNKLTVINVTGLAIAAIGILMTLK